MTTNKQNNTTKNNENSWNQNDDDDDEFDDWDDWNDAEEEFDASNQNEKLATTDKKKQNDVLVCQNLANQNQNTEEESSWSSWSTRFTHALSTASDGLGNIIGAPTPEQLVAEEDEQCNKNKKSLTLTEVTKAQNDAEKATPALKFKLVSGVTKVLNVGLGTLEEIGKKTYDILQEHEKLGFETQQQQQQQPNLSDLLKEAKKDADIEEKTVKQLKFEEKLSELNFNILFENYAGAVHFEALEMLSKESALKLESLMDSASGDALKDLLEITNEVEELLELEHLECESESEGEAEYTAEDLNERLQCAIEDSGMSLTFDDITEHWAQTINWLHILNVDDDVVGTQEIFCQGVVALSKSCALQVAKLHKFSELLLVKEHHSTANEVDSVVQLCKEFIAHLHGIGKRFAKQINVINATNAEPTKKAANQLIIEMSTSLLYIDKCYKLFLPILQIGAV